MECPVSVRPIESRTLARMAGIRHGFFTREGGVSTGPCASLNCGYGAKDDARENVTENRSRAAAALGIPSDRLRTAYQIHSADAILADDAWDSTAPPRADAIVASEPGLGVGVLTADCAPVLLADAGAGVVAAAHAGWRGALGGVLDSVVDAMVGAGARRRSICAAVGPTISAAVYEVGTEFHERFLREDPASAAFFRGGAGVGPLRFDLPGYALYRLTAAGVCHVENAGHCTYESEKQFFSHRRAMHRGEGEYGRLLSAIALE